MGKEEHKNNNISATSPEERPFLGLRSFEEKNKSQFGGRDEEIETLYSLIDKGSLTVVFGKSGIGKTSLLKAGLIPKLRRNFYFPIYYRIDYSSSKLPLQQVKEFIYQTISEKDPSVKPVGDMTLWEYFHDINMLDGMLTPVLILDQFEETFTLGGSNAKGVKEMILALADLAENRVPVVVQEKYQKNNDTIPSKYSEPSCSVVLSLREDYLARLEELKGYIPTIMERRFRVLQMTISQAQDAAVKPGNGLLEEDVALEIIKKLPGISQADFDILDSSPDDSNKNLKIEPFLLSLICDRLNEERIKQGLDKITLELVSEFNVPDVIHSFYNDTISQFDTSVEHAIEDRLLTEGGFRKLQVVEEMQLAYKIPSDTIDKLVDARIVRKERRDGVDYVELIHDVLAPIIRAKRDKRIVAEQAAKRQKRIMLQRKKNRAKILQIGLGIGLVLATVSVFAYINYNKRRKLEKQNYELAFARELLNKAESYAYFDTSNEEKAALLSGIAYKIHSDNKFNEGVDRDDIFFYRSMYTILSKNDSIKDIFDFETFSSAIRSFSYDSNNEIYVGLKDGTVRNKEKEVLFLASLDGPQQIGDIAINKSGNKNLMAIAGTFPYVEVVNLDNPEEKNRIPISNLGVGKQNSVKFLKNGELYIRQKNSVVHIADDLKKRVPWDERDFKKWHYLNDTLHLSKDSISNDIRWKRSYLTPNEELYSMDVLKDSTLAIGIRNGFLLITNDSYHEIRYDDLGKVTAMQFQNTGEHLILGNERGEVFTVPLEFIKEDTENKLNFKIKTFLSQTKIINAIAVNERDDKWIATASRDGTIALWNTDDWHFALKIHPREFWSSRKVYGSVNWIEFSPDGKFLLAGYRSGTILKWPLINTLEQLICATAYEDQKIKEVWVEWVEREDLQISEFECTMN